MLTSREFTILTAFADVQQISVSALTSAEVFTYETTGTPGYFFFKFLTSSPVIEDDKEPKVTDTIDLGKDDVVVFSKSDTEWRKGEGFNKGIKLAKTNILNFIDTDIIIDPNQLLETADRLREDDNAGLMYPYNGLFLCAEKPLKDKFCETLNYEELLIVPEAVESYIGIKDKKFTDQMSYVNKVYNDILIGHMSSKGGCVMGRKDNLVKCNGYNPNFCGFGTQHSSLGN